MNTKKKNDMTTIKLDVVERGRSAAPLELRESKWLNDNAGLQKIES